VGLVRPPVGLMRPLVVWVCPPDGLVRLPSGFGVSPEWVWCIPQAGSVHPLTCSAIFLCADVLLTCGSLAILVLNC
jgi:hypothetical protein